MKTLSEVLKESTAGRHARMEALPFVAALASGELPLGAYVAQLRALSVIHAALEAELRQAGLPEVSALFGSRPSRLAHLRADLSAFDPLLLRDCLRAVAHAQGIAEWIRRARIEEPNALLGCVYVLEGTTLGNTVHLPDVEGAFGDRALGATRYYAGYGSDTLARWQEVRALLDALPLDDAGRDGLVGAAHRLFDLLEPLYAALHPVAEEGWGFTATTLNPEGGTHPVPGGEAELRAAVEAARRCREEFPYFDERYGERGRSFAKSDAAWLVTLAALPPAQCRAQVEWLGRVLGNRGMPRLTLERQLELLHEELSAASAGPRDPYAGLLESARGLRAERLGLLPEDAFRAVAERFRAATDGELGGTLRGTGALLASAACDEAAGITEAASSFTSWLADPSRFSPQWVAAVEEALSQARQGLERR